MKTQLEAAGLLGIPVRKVRELRDKLAEGDHWVRNPEDQREILLTFAGMAELRALLGLPAGPEAAGTPPAAENAPSGQPGALAGPLVEVLAVHSGPRIPTPEGMAHFPNTRIIEARRECGEVVRVLVRSSVNFRRLDVAGRPMVFRARRAEGSNVWELDQNQRCPRWPGRW